jgi:hypothetical protein
MLLYSPPMNRVHHRVRSGGRIGWLTLAALGLAAGGCASAPQVELRHEITQLQDTVRQRDNQIVAQKASIEELHQQLATARGISEDDLKRLFYPQELVIDRLTGGVNLDNKPGDDGVTLYLRPIDQYGDVIKVPGDVTIQIYDLAAAPAHNLVGEYHVTVDQIGKLWYGKLMTGHYTIKCPWPKGPPEHNELTVRVVFVDYLTKRVVAAQAVVKVQLPP